jgi:hypothetical protein
MGREPSGSGAILEVVVVPGDRQAVPRGGLGPRARRSPTLFQ